MGVIYHRAMLTRCEIVSIVTDVNFLLICAYGLVTEFAGTLQNLAAVLALILVFFVVGLVVKRRVKYHSDLWQDYTHLQSRLERIRYKLVWLDRPDLLLVDLEDVLEEMAKLEEKETPPNQKLLIWAQEQATLGYHNP